MLFSKRIELIYLQDNSWFVNLRYEYVIVSSLNVLTDRRYALFDSDIHNSIIQITFNDDKRQ
jgi:hypothetical protein